MTNLRIWRSLHAARFLFPWRKHRNLRLQKCQKLRLRHWLNHGKEMYQICERLAGHVEIFFCSLSYNLSQLSYLSISFLLSRHCLLGSLLELLLLSCLRLLCNNIRLRLSTRLGAAHQPLLSAERRLPRRPDHPTLSTFDTNGSGSQKYSRSL